MGQISGTVFVRPARVGLIAETFTTDVVRKAVGWACSVWGGMCFPMLSARDPGLDLVSEMLGVDFWFPLDDDERTVKVCEKPGFRWQGRAPMVRSTRLKTDW